MALAVGRQTGGDGGELAQRGETDTLIRLRQHFTLLLHGAQLQSRRWAEHTHTHTHTLRSFRSEEGVPARASSQQVRLNVCVAQNGGSGPKCYGKDGIRAAALISRFISSSALTRSLARSVSERRLRDT